MPSTEQIILPIDCRSIALSDIQQFDALITDPPYSEHTHTKAVSVTGSGGALYGARKREFGFAHLGDELRDWTAKAAASVKRWSVIYSDIESTHLMRSAVKGAGGTYIRTLAWIRWSMPQLSADRPPSGREDLMIFHKSPNMQELADADQANHLALLEQDDKRAWALEMLSGQDPITDLVLFYGAQKGRKAWNGPGNLTHLQHKCLRGDGKHRAEKPLDQALDLVDWFTEPGETVFDPFAGSGTLGLACRLLERNYVGCELDPKWSAFASTRIANAALSDRDTERMGRWLESRGLSR